MHYCHTQGWGSGSGYGSGRIRWFLNRRIRIRYFFQRIRIRIIRFSSFRFEVGSGGGVGSGAVVVFQLSRIGICGKKLRILLPDFFSFFRMLNNKLSVQYENGKVAKYVSGERMHNGKFIIIAHKQDCSSSSGVSFCMIWYKTQEEIKGIELI